MHCRKCSHYNPDGAKFCAECGAALGQPQPVVPLPVQAAKPAPPQTNTVIIHKKGSGGAIALFLLFCAAAVGGSLVLNNYQIERQRNWLGQEKPIIDFKADDSGVAGKLNLPGIKRKSQPAETYAEQSIPSQQTADSYAPSLSSARRVQFEQGATSETYYGRLNSGNIDKYILNAKAKQILTLYLSSKNQPPIMSVSFNGREVFGRDEVDMWTGALPQSGDYVITLTATNDATTYNLEVNVE